MSRVDVEIPRMLAAITAGDRVTSVDARTVAGALEALCCRYPELAIHVFDESGALRPHLVVFVNGALHPPSGAPVGDGDLVTVLQAVSGG